MSKLDDYVIKSVHDLDGKPWYVFVRKSEIKRIKQEAKNGRNKNN